MVKRKGDIFILFFVGVVLFVCGDYQNDYFFMYSPGLVCRIVLLIDFATVSEIYIRNTQLYTSIDLLMNRVKHVLSLGHRTILYYVK